MEHTLLPNSPFQKDVFPADAAPGAAAPELVEPSRLLRLPAELQREITAWFCGLQCGLSKAFERQRLYGERLAELDNLRHNVRIGVPPWTCVRTLKEWAERDAEPVIVAPPTHRHPELRHRSVAEIAVFRYQAFGRWRWRLWPTYVMRAARSARSLLVRSLLRLLRRTPDAPVAYAPGSVPPYDPALE